MLFVPSMEQNFLKLPGFSGIVTDITASRSSPISARSDTCRSRSKFILAPEAIATIVLPRSSSRLQYSLAPAIESAPDGSNITRVSSNTSLIAAQMASVSTKIISSTSSRQRRKVSLPTCLIATPSANTPT